LLGQIDKNISAQTPTVWLCKPNKERISPLKEIKNKINISYKYNDIHEVNISIPLYVVKEGKVVKNKHADMIKGKYLLEFESEYFVIDKINKKGNRDSTSLEIHAFHLPYELKDKVVREYKSIVDLQVGDDPFFGPKNLMEAMSETLETMTEWRVDYIDADFLLTKRAMDVSEQSLLQFIFETAKSFGAVVFWNSNTRKVSFYKLENLGTDKGLYISDKRYLKEISENINFETVTTRLNVFGKDGMSIQTVNPTGQKFIENLSYFMHPYEEDGSRNIIKSSKWMSDSLCYQLTTYYAFLETQEGQFQSLLNILVQKQSEYLTIRNDLIDLLQQREVVIKIIILKSDTGADASVEIAERNALTSQINIKQAELEQKNSEIVVAEGNLTTFRNVISIENHLGPEELKEKTRFEITRTFENPSFFKQEDLLNAAKEELQRSSFPPIDVEMQIVNFLKVIKSQRDWNKLKIGDVVTLSYEELGIAIKTKIHEINIDYDSNSISVRISNFARLMSDQKYFEEMLYKGAKSSTQINVNQKYWDTSKNTNNFIRQLIEEGWDANKLAIYGGYDNEVTINSQGLLIRDPENENDFLIARNSILAITNDGGNTFKNAITKSGIIAERIIGQILIGEQLTVSTGENGHFRVDENGVLISGAALTITGGISEDNLQDTFLDSLLKKDITYSNGIRIDSANGLVVTRNDDRVRTTVNASQGIKIETKSGASYEDVFFVDSQGNLNVKGNITLDGGFINWANVNSPELPPGYTDSDALAIIESTYIDGNGVWTPNVYANNINVSSGKIRANQIEVNELFVGPGGITLDHRAVLTWGNLSTETQQNLTGPQGPQGPSGGPGPQGPPGPGSELPSWVTAWNGNATEITANYILSPYIWAGSGSLPSALGGVGSTSGVSLDANGIRSWVNGQIAGPQIEPNRHRLSFFESGTIKGEIDYDFKFDVPMGNSTNRFFLRAKGNAALKLESENSNISIDAGSGSYDDNGNFIGPSQSRSIWIRALSGVYFMGGTPVHSSGGLVIPVGVDRYVTG